MSDEVKPTAEEVINDKTEKGNEVMEGDGDKGKEKKVDNDTKKTHVSEEKKKLVVELADKIKKSKTILLASIKGLPSSQYNQIKKDLRGKVEINVAKKSLMFRAIGTIEKGSLQNLKEHIGADVAVLFSDIDAFELSGMLSENQSSTKAKAGDIAPEDIEIEPGPTELMPGPDISGLSSVGLKVAVENGKIAIKKGATIVKEGEVIDENISGVLGKLGVEPMKVGFVPLAAYDSEADKIYENIKIDKEGTLEALREAIGKSKGFAIGVGYVVKETVGFLIGKAGAEAGALEKVVGAAKPAEEEKPAAEGGEGEKEEEEEKPAAVDNEKTETEKGNEVMEGDGDKGKEKKEEEKTEDANNDKGGNA